MGPSLIWDHLFLVREGWRYTNIQEFKVVTLGRFFETGSMAGLMRLFRRHSGLWTNFKIYYLESRPIGPGRAYLSAGSLGVRKGPAGTLECPGGRRYRGLGMGWALAIPMWGARVGGRGSTRYSTLPLPTPGTTPPPTTPGTAPLDVAAGGEPVSGVHAHMTVLGCP